MGRAYIQDHEVWFIITLILLTNYYDNRSLLQLQYTLITVITKLSSFTAISRDEKTLLYERDKRR